MSEVKNTSIWSVNLVIILLVTVYLILLYGFWGTNFTNFFVEANTLINGIPLVIALMYSAMYMNHRRIASEQKLRQGEYAMTIDKPDVFGELDLSKYSDYTLDMLEHAYSEIHSDRLDVEQTYASKQQKEEEKDPLHVEYIDDGLPTSIKVHAKRDMRSQEKFAYDYAVHKFLYEEAVIQLVYFKKKSTMMEERIRALEQEEDILNEKLDDFVRVQRELNDKVEYLEGIINKSIPFAASVLEYHGVPVQEESEATEDVGGTGA